MGAFGHGELKGDLEYPDAGSLRGREGDELRWFEYWLEGVDNGIMDEPAVTYYQMAAARRPATAQDQSPAAAASGATVSVGTASDGAASGNTTSSANGNRYLTATTWPPPGSRPVRWYLHEGRRLGPAAPAENGGATTYSFDPARPVPTVGGPNLTLPIGPMDQREIGQRADYLRFQTEPLAEDLTLAGKLDVELWVASDGPDTDFMVKLVDVYPDGYEAIVIDTAQRARYRGGRRAEDVAMLEPDQPTRLAIDLWNTAITIERGHRLALHVTSSNHPRFEVNPNTGEPPGGEKAAPRVARNTIFHDAGHPSAVILPVME
jgi:putative CocE/NonD family hydrolase